MTRNADGVNVSLVRLDAHGCAKCAPFLSRFKNSPLDKLRFTKYNDCSLSYLYFWSLISQRLFFCAFSVSATDR